MAVRDYEVIVMFLADELSAEAKAELEGWLPADYKEHICLTYDRAADGGKGAFVGNEDHSGEDLHDEAEALKAFERAKEEFASKKELGIKLWWSDDAGECGMLRFSESL
jgi:hypothetical protein